MARIRTIKPEFPQSGSIGRLSRETRLCFIQLWTLADDVGRLRGASRMLASLLYPYDDDAPSLIDTWLCELEREGCIQRYKSNGDQYIQIINWLIHQKIDKPSRSKIPPFVEPSRILANPRERSSGDQGSEDQGPKDQGSGPVPTRVNSDFEFVGKIPPDPKLEDSARMDAFAVVRMAYPKREGRDTWIYAERAWTQLLDQGIPAAAILAGVERYARYCAAGGVSTPKYVMDPEKFFKAPDKPWMQPWDPPQTKGEVIRDKNISASVAWLEKTNAG
jgi:hypothetical protein